MRTSLAVLAWALVPFAVSSAACSMLHPAGKDAGPPDASPVAVIDAAPPPPPVPANVNEVARFPDEVSLNDVSAKIEDPHVVARNSVPGGAAVATLGLSATVIQIASHQSFILASFVDPKNPQRNLEGWLPKEAFVAGPTPPRHAGCPAGEVALVFEDQDFCGRECKTDKDCGAGQACSGKANVLVAGKPGAETDTCTVPAPGTTPATPGAPTAIATIIGVQQPPLANGTCAPKYTLASDHVCHFECNVSPKQCPPKSRCTAKLTTPTTPVCEEDK